MREEAENERSKSRHLDQKNCNNIQLLQFFLSSKTGLERRVKKTRLEWRVFSGRRDSELKQKINKRRMPFMNIKAQRSNERRGGKRAEQVLSPRPKILHRHLPMQDFFILKTGLERVGSRIANVRKKMEKSNATKQPTERLFATPA